MLPHVERVRADGAVGRALERIYTLLTALVRSRTLLTWEFTTASVIANGFPVYVPFRAFVPKGISIVRLENVTAPGTSHTSAVWCDWEPGTDGFVVRYVSGLSTSTQYRATLEIRGD